MTPCANYAQNNRFLEVPIIEFIRYISDFLEEIGTAECADFAHKL
jgi:hypothetical protein